MWIDTAGNNELASGVDNTVRFHLQVRANDGDALVLNQNVSSIIIDRRHNAAILNECFHSYFFRHGFVPAVSAERRAASLAFGPGEIFSITQISLGVIFITDRSE